MDSYDVEREQLLAQFGSNVRRARMELSSRHGSRRGLSQEALSERAGLHRTEIAKIELGHTEPRLSTLLILAEVFGISLDDLAEGLQAPRRRRPAPQARPRK
ncbi:MAG: helix-turn-helix transcriptional regulator [Solirubrobacteraceae bacterium]|jgi:ribosome-binding protein aMBF1 (putative translation factor)